MRLSTLSRSSEQENRESRSRETLLIHNAKRSNRRRVPALSRLEVPTSQGAILRTLEVRASFRVSDAVAQIRIRVLLLLAILPTHVSLKTVHYQPTWRHPLETSVIYSARCLSHLAPIFSSAYLTLPKLLLSLVAYRVLYASTKTRKTVRLNQELRFPISK
jgi:hypothetical protein